MIGKLAVLGVIVTLVAAPVLLREPRQMREPLEVREPRQTLPAASPNSAASPALSTSLQRLVILTPHGADIRREFTLAFCAYEHHEHGREVEIDWRTPGGTSEISRFMDDRFRAAFSERFPEHRGGLAGFNQGNLDEHSPAAERAARAAFLASDVGIGADLLFGGGEFAFRTHADKGYLIDTGLQAQEPSWFGGATPIIAQNVSGETVYDKSGRYYGACFGVFGIAYSPDRLAELGLAPPTGWSDIAGPAYRGQLTLTDPTKSGAAATTFERILQQRMAAQPMALAAGWADGVSVIKRLVANSRWITDSASKPTRDAVRGDCAAGMAIDFQAKIESEFALHGTQAPARLVFVVPVGGTSVSADPLAVLRGAPEAQIAADFLHFVLSTEGQKLWSQRLGTPGGPQQVALRRFPVRRDLVGPEQRAWRSDPDEDPFAIAQGFTYHREWTGRYFTLINTLVKLTALDSRHELTLAWDAICAAGGPAQVPEAWAEFCWLPVAYDEAASAQAELDTLKKKDPVGLIRRQREWLEEATLHYRLAAALAQSASARAEKENQ